MGALLDVGVHPPPGLRSTPSPALVPTCHVFGCSGVVAGTMKKMMAKNRETNQAKAMKSNSKMVVTKNHKIMRQTRMAAGN